MKALVCVFLIFNLSCTTSREANATDQLDQDEERLLHDLFEGRNYNKNIRPVKRKGDAINVTLGMTLFQIINVVEKTQIITTSLFFRQSWHNPFLTWNASEYGGLTQLNIDPKILWKPDIYLYNNADDDVDGSMNTFKTLIKVNSTGHNMWLAPVIPSTTCKMNVKYFPFDMQHCDFKFGSWTYDGYQVNVVTESDSADLEKFQSNGEWKLIAFPCQRNVQYYKCCTQPFPDITFTLVIRRLVTYYYINLIVPCYLIAGLSLLSFYLPTESGERITLVITNMLALTVFMLLVAGILPETSEVVPLISIYFSCTIIEVGLALVATCVVLKCYHMNPSFSEIPVWVRYLVLDKLARLLRIETKNKKLDLKNKNKKEKSNNSFGRNGDPRFAGVRLRNKSQSFARPESEHLLSVQPSAESSGGNVFCQMCEDKGVKTLHLNGGLNFRRGSRVSEVLLDVNKVGKSTLGRTQSAYSYLSDFDNIQDQQTFQNPERIQCVCGTSSCQDFTGRLLHQQKHLVEDVRKLARLVEDQEQTSERQEEWAIVAHIADTVFMYMFILTLVISTVVIFMNVPEYSKDI